MCEVFKYRLLQLVPDLVRDERMNVGLIVWGGGSLDGVTLKFLEDVGRIRSNFGEVVAVQYLDVKGFFEENFQRNPRYFTELSRGSTNSFLRWLEPRVHSFPSGTGIDAVTLELFNRLVS